MLLNIFKPKKFRYGTKIHGTKLSKNSPIEVMPLEMVITPFGTTRR